tara:strand:- start:28 stop:402 length:375 start_codon:yes stop_codon:yes gene_type:complete
MAILTTGFNIHQSGLTPDSVDISFSGLQLTVEAPAISQGGFTLAASGNRDIVTSGASKSVYLYVINKSTSGGGIVTLRDTADAFAKLNPGDFAFFPVDVSTTINCLEVGGAHSADIEYCFFTRT